MYKTFEMEKWSASPDPFRLVSQQQQQQQKTEALFNRFWTKHTVLWETIQYDTLHCCTPADDSRKNYFCSTLGLLCHLKVSPAAALKVKSSLVRLETGATVRNHAWVIVQPCLCKFIEKWLNDTRLQIQPCRNKSSFHHACNVLVLGDVDSTLWSLWRLYFVVLLNWIVYCFKTENHRPILYEGRFIGWNAVSDRIGYLMNCQPSECF